MMSFDVMDAAHKILGASDHYEVEDMLMLKRGEVAKIIDGTRELSYPEARRIVALFVNRLEETPHPRPIKYSVNDYLNAVDYYEYRQQILTEARRAVQQVVQEELKPIIGVVLASAMKGEK